MSLKAISLLLLFISISAEARIIQAVSIFRHGARYTLNSLYDGNTTEPWWGELTGVGMRQHQTLGTLLRREYIQNLGLLSPNYTKGEIQVYSTTVNRTIQSVISQFEGLYPDGTGPRLLSVDESFYLPPFTNDTDSQTHDSALPNAHQQIPIKFSPKIMKHHCKNEKKWYKKNIELQIDQYNEMNLTYYPFIVKMKQLFQLTGNVTLKTMKTLFGDLQVSVHRGKPLPAGLTPEDWKNLKHLTDWYHMLIETRDLAKAKNKYKLQKIISVFDSAIKTPNQLHKFTFLSGHDSDLLPLLTDLNMSSSRCVEQLYRKGSTSSLNCRLGAPFASSLIFELHDQNDTFNIRIRSEGEYMNLCGQRSTTCSYEHWKQIIRDNQCSDQLAEQICGTYKTHQASYEEDFKKQSAWIQSLRTVMMNST